MTEFERYDVHCRAPSIHNRVAEETHRGTDMYIREMEAWSRTTVNSGGVKAKLNSGKIQVSGFLSRMEKPL
jgi:hypothetical protein